MLKQKKKARIFWDENSKATQLKQKIHLEEINQKVLAKEARLKRYRDRIKQYRQNRTFQNNERKFYPQVGGKITKINPQLNSSEAKQFWSKIWEPRDHSRTTKWINRKKEMRGLEESPKINKHLDSLRATLKKIPNWKTADHDGMHSSFKNSHPFMIYLMSKWIDAYKKQMTLMDDKRKDQPDQESP